MSETEEEGVPPKKEKKEKRKLDKKQKPKSEQAAVERKLGGVVPPPPNAVREFVRGQSYVTPVVLAEHFGLKVGIAKKLLRDLEKERVISLVSGDRRMGIYAPPKAPGEETGGLGEPPPTQPKPVERRKKKRRR
ncbi:MAG: hypothetical protein ACETV0_06455 [Nitrososphaeria archaeon]